MNDRVLLDAIDTLKKLITIPSFSGAEERAADYLQGLLEGYFPQCVSRILHNVIVDIKGREDGPTLLLCSHIDTVKALDTWTRDPFKPEIDGDKLYGLGSNDAGASLVSLIAAARLVCPLRKGRILLCLVAEEEEGHNGFANIESELPRYDGAIFGEPTNMRMATAIRGAMLVTMKSRGVGSHASTPWEGKNAIDKFALDLLAVRSIDLKDNSVWGGATIEPTVIYGGESPNQVPSYVETTLNIRSTPEKNNEWIMGALKSKGLEVEFSTCPRHPIENGPGSDIVKAFRDSYPERPECVFNASCDMAFSKADSIVLGPGDLKIAHVADEYALISSIQDAVSVYKKVVETFIYG